MAAPIQAGTLSARSSEDAQALATLQVRGSLGLPRGRAARASGRSTPRRAFRVPKRCQVRGVPCGGRRAACEARARAPAEEPQRVASVLLSGWCGRVAPRHARSRAPFATFFGGGRDCVCVIGRARRGCWRTSGARGAAVAVVVLGALQSEAEALWVSCASRRARARHWPRAAAVCTPREIGPGSGVL